MGMVREALERVQLAAKEEEEEKLEEREAMDDVQEITHEPVKRVIETRKRKAPARRASSG